MFEVLKSAVSIVTSMLMTQSVQSIGKRGPYNQRMSCPSSAWTWSSVTNGLSAKYCNRTYMLIGEPGKCVLEISIWKYNTGLTAVEWIRYIRLVKNKITYGDVMTWGSVSKCQPPWNIMLLRDNHFSCVCAYLGNHRRKQDLLSSKIGRVDRNWEIHHSYVCRL